MRRRYHWLGADGAAWVGPIYDKPAASAARGISSMKRAALERGKHMTFVRAVKNFFELDKPAYPTSEEIPNKSDAHSHHEHVEA